MINVSLSFHLLHLILFIRNISIIACRVNRLCIIPRHTFYAFFNSISTFPLICIFLPVLCPHAGASFLPGVNRFVPLVELVKRRGWRGYVWICVCACRPFVCFLSAGIHVIFMQNRANQQADKKKKLNPQQHLPSSLLILQETQRPW